MKELKVDWEKAPEGANVALFENGALMWWVAADFEEDTYRSRLVGRPVWSAPRKGLKHVLTMPGRAYVKKPEPYVFNAKE